LPVAQLVQLAPPQSASLSPPFGRPSVQLGGWQRVELHTPLTQSRPRAQPLPSAHAAHCPPPQSTLVSEPFLTESPQPAG
jgi:hypothetical protein